MKRRSNSYLVVLLIGLVACSGSDSGNNGGTNSDTDVGVIPGNSAGNNTDNSAGNAAESQPLTNPLDGIQSVQLVGSGFNFLEGPAYRPSDNSLFFSDIPEDTIFQLLPDGSIEPFRENQQTNGLAFDGQDRLLIATNGGQTLSRLEASGTITVLAERFEGAAFNSPNDLALHTNGDVYFTDPPFAIDPATSETGCAGVYRLAADGSLSRFWCNGIDTRPNGIALSPNQERLYVSFSSGGQILSWPIEADGRVVEAVDTFAMTAGFPDGMTVDAEGNVFVTSTAGVEVFAADGTLWGVIEIPERASNVTLGGPDDRTLFITARSGLYVVGLQNR